MATSPNEYPDEDTWQQLEADATTPDLEEEYAEDVFDCDTLR